MENNDKHEEWDSGCNTASCYAKEVKDGYLITTEGGEEVATMKRSKKIVTYGTYEIFLTIG